MDLLSLLVARSLKIPFALNYGVTEKQPQAEPELPAIDFALLLKVTHKTRQSNRSRGTFSGRPATLACS